MRRRTTATASKSPLKVSSGPGSKKQLPAGDTAVSVGSQAALRLERARHLGHQPPLTHAVTVGIAGSGSAAFFRRQPFASNAVRPLQAERGSVQRTPTSLDELEKVMELLGEEALFGAIPDEEYAAELNRALATKDPKERQQAIAAVVEAYEIGFVDDPMLYDEELEEDEGQTEGGSRPRIGPGAFGKALERGRLAHLRLALTLAHENLHRQQYRRFGETQLVNLSAEVRKNLPTDDYEAVMKAQTKEWQIREALAYDAELLNIERFRNVFYGGTAPQEAEKILVGFEKEATEEREYYLGISHAFSLTKDEVELYRAGKYAALLHAIRQSVRSDAVRSYEGELTGKSTDWGEDQEDGPFWRRFEDASWMLRRLQEIAKGLQKRPHSSTLRRQYRFLENRLGDMYLHEDTRLGHWWLVRGVDDLATLDLDTEIEKLEKELVSG